jgi:hypothetical protein
LFGIWLTKRYQYTAIDDATRVRALKIYARHNQKNACDFTTRIAFNAHGVVDMAID